MSTPEERRLCALAMRSIEEASLGLGDISRGVDFPSARSQTTGNDVSGSQSQQPMPVSQRNRAYSSGSSNDNRARNQLSIPTLQRNRAPSSGQGNTIRMVRSQQSIAGTAPIPTLPRNGGPNYGSGGPMPTEQRNREPGWGPDSNVRTDWNQQPMSTMPRSREPASGPGNNVHRAWNEQPMPTFQSNRALNPGSRRPVPTFQRNRAPTLGQGERMPTEQRIREPGWEQHNNARGDWYQQPAPIPQSSREPSSGAGGPMPTEQRIREQGWEPDSTRADWYQQPTPIQQGSRAPSSGPGGFQRSASRDGPGFQTNPTLVGGSQPRTNFQQPRNDYGREGLAPGSFSHPHVAQRSVLPGNNDPLQIAAEMITTPWPAMHTMQAVQAVPAVQSAPIIPMLQTGPIVQSVQAFRAVQTVQAIQDYPTPQAALTLQTTGVAQTEQAIQTAQVVQALEDLQTSSSSPKKRRRRRLQTRRAPPPQLERGSSSSSSAPVGAATQETVFPLSWLYPDHPEGYPQLPPFQHNREEPNRRAAAESHAGNPGPPIGSVPNPIVMLSEYRGGAGEGQGSRGVWGRQGGGAFGQHLAGPSAPSAFSYEPTMSSYEAEMAATMRSNEASERAAGGRGQAREGIPNPPGFGYFDHEGLAPVEPPRRAPAYASGADPNAGLMSAEQAAVAWANPQRLTLMIDGGFDCTFSAVTGEDAGEDDEGEGGSGAGSK